MVENILFRGTHAVRVTAKTVMHQSQSSGTYLQLQVYLYIDDELVWSAAPWGPNQYSMQSADSGEITT